MTTPAPTAPQEPHRQRAYIITEDRLKRILDYLMSNEVTFSEGWHCAESAITDLEEYHPAAPVPACQYWIVARVAGIDGDTNEWCCSRPQRSQRHGK